MLDGEPLLIRIRSSPPSEALLAGLFEFDIARAYPLDDVRLASGMAIQAVAGDGGGGTFLLCGEATSRRTVLYASSEGEAGSIATDLASALELVVGMPYWRDCLKFSASGDLDEMRLAATHLEREMAEDYSAEDFSAAGSSASGVSTIAQQQAQLRRELGLPQRSTDQLLTLLHSAVAGTVPDFVLIGPDGAAYDSLFNSFRVADNPDWR